MINHAQHRGFEIRQHENWTIISIKEAAHSEIGSTWVLPLVDELMESKKYLLALIFEKETYLYSKLISLLVSCSKKIKVYGGKLVIVNPAPHILQTLGSLKLLDTVIFTVPSIDHLT